MPVLLTTQLDRHSQLVATDRLSLTAEERSRSRHPHVTDGGREVYLQLKRGTNLRHGDRLQAAGSELVVEILAKPEQVMVVTAIQPLDLLQAVYHLGNRHVPLEITDDRLYLLPDPVLQDLLHQRGLQVLVVERPFQPQAGAYEATPHHHHH
ncbi:urease accessory protein UreE [Chamaesiphon sp.]|uniref:urease accessory protein UreE n=1 Tax=Chamaesiphon sp. TaxID=2814140 RepID=UPI00359413BA